MIGNIKMQGVGDQTSQWEGSRRKDLKMVRKQEKGPQNGKETGERTSKWEGCERLDLKMGEKWEIGAEKGREV